MKLDCTHRLRPAAAPLPTSYWLSTQTNAYDKHCNTEPPPRKPDTRKEHQKKKSRTAGFITLKDPAEGETGPFEERHIHGMVGIMMAMGLTRKYRMRNHWGEGPHDNYPLVRACMQRDLFELLYCRFLHCSDPNAPPRLLPDGQENPDYDSKWHIRCLRFWFNFFELEKRMRCLRVGCCFFLGE